MFSGRALNTTSYTEAELNAMTKTQLLELADELGVEGLSMNNLKADIINAILTKQEG